jgi:hypothetical protein
VSRHGGKAFRPHPTSRRVSPGTKRSASPRAVAPLVSMAAALAASDSDIWLAEMKGGKQCFTQGIPLIDKRTRRRPAVLW